MARGKSKAVVATSDSIENQEVVTTTENVEIKEIELAEEIEKEFDADEIVKIKCMGLAGSKVIGLDSKNPISFDADGIAEVSGIEANRFLTIPGYELLK